MCVNPKTIECFVGHREKIVVGCGKCSECLKARANEWAFRLMLEKRLHKDCFFFTLTYNETEIPPTFSVYKFEFQNFIKRLRKYLKGVKIKYFGCGEYGSKVGRPHYHGIIFGWKPDDLIFHHYDKKRNPIFVSEKFGKIWQRLSYSGSGEKVSCGFHSICPDVTLKNSIYCAKYLQKLNVEGSQGCCPSFILMSKKLGVGAWNYKTDTDSIYVDGKSIRLPRYFLKCAEKEGEILDDLKSKRWSLYDLKQSGYIFTSQERKIHREKVFRGIDKL